MTMTRPIRSRRSRPSALIKRLRTSVIAFAPAVSRARNSEECRVEKNPTLEPAWSIAMQDEVLTEPEAKVIVEAAGEKVEMDK